MDKRLVLAVLSAGCYAAEPAYFFGGQLSSDYDNDTGTYEFSAAEKYAGVSLGVNKSLTQFLYMGFEGGVRIPVDSSDKGRVSFNTDSYRLLLDAKPSWRFSEALHMFGMVGIDAHSLDLSDTLKMRFGGGLEAFFSNKLSMVLQFIGTSTYEDIEKGSFTDATVTLGAHLYC